MFDLEPADPERSTVNITPLHYNLLSVVAACSFVLRRLQHYSIPASFRISSNSAPLIERNLNPDNFDPTKSDFQGNDERQSITINEVQDVDSWSTFNMHLRYKKSFCQGRPHV